MRREGEEGALEPFCQKKTLSMSSQSIHEDELR